jgi:hypothetical protein
MEVFQLSCRLWVKMESPIFKVIFQNQAQIYEVYVQQIYQSDLYGFIEVEEFLFGEKNQLIVDPGEEKLKSEFGAVKRSYIPMHAIIRIDEVERQGVPKVSENTSGGNVTAFPLGGAFRPGMKDS